MTHLPPVHISASNIDQGLTDGLAASSGLSVSSGPATPTAGRDAVRSHQLGPSSVQHKVDAFQQVLDSEQVSTPTSTGSSTTVAGGASFRIVRAAAGVPAAPATLLTAASGSATSSDKSHGSIPSEPVDAAPGQMTTSHYAAAAEEPDDKVAAAIQLLEQQLQMDAASASMQAAQQQQRQGTLVHVLLRLMKTLQQQDGVPSSNVDGPQSVMTESSSYDTAARGVSQGAGNTTVHLSELINTFLQQSSSAVPDFGAVQTVANGSMLHSNSTDKEHTALSITTAPVATASTSSQAVAATHEAAAQADVLPPTADISTQVVLPSNTDAASQAQLTPDMHTAGTQVDTSPFLSHTHTQAAPSTSDTAVQAAPDTQHALVQAVAAPDVQHAAVQAVDLVQQHGDTADATTQATGADTGLVMQPEVSHSATQVESWHHHDITPSTADYSLQQPSAADMVQVTGSTQAVGSTSGTTAQAVPADSNGTDLTSTAPEQQTSQLITTTQDASRTAINKAAPQLSAAAAAAAAPQSSTPQQTSSYVSITTPAGAAGPPSLLGNTSSAIPATTAVASLPPAPPASSAEEGKHVRSGSGVFYAGSGAELAIGKVAVGQSLDLIDQLNRRGNSSRAVSTDTEAVVINGTIVRKDAELADLRHAVEESDDIDMMTADHLLDVRVEDLKDLDAVAQGIRP